MIMGRSNDKRELILKNSARIFSHKGYFGTGVNEILTACNIPKGSFYHYFPGGKEQLAVEVLRFAYEEMVEGIKTNIFSVSDNAVDVFSYMLDHLSVIFNKRHIFESLVITFMGLESVYISEELSRESTRVYEQWQELYRLKLIDCGYSEEDAARYSLTLFTLVHGSLISCWIKQNTEDLQRMKQQLPFLLP